MHGGMPMYTPPQTPGYVAATPLAAAHPAGAVTAVKRENEGGEDGSRDKRRRIAPTLVSEQWVWLEKNEERWRQGGEWHIMELGVLYHEGNGWAGKGRSFRLFFAWDTRFIYRLPGKGKRDMAFIIEFALRVCGFQGLQLWCCFYIKYSFI
jgi:hypothetical protein